jgi:hypothetical protein
MWPGYQSTLAAEVHNVQSQLGVVRLLSAITWSGGWDDVDDGDGDGDLQGSGRSLLQSGGGCDTGASTTAWKPDNADPSQSELSVQSNGGVACACGPGALGCSIAVYSSRMHGSRLQHRLT